MLSNTTNQPKSTAEHHLCINVSISGSIPYSFDLKFVSNANHENWIPTNKKYFTVTKFSAHVENIKKDIYRGEIRNFSSHVESIKKNVRYHVAHEVLDKDDLDALAPYNWLSSS